MMEEESSRRLMQNAGVSARIFDAVSLASSARGHK